MQNYPLDIDPQRLVRWIQAEYTAVPSTFRVTAIRKREVHEIPARRETHFGDQEREDLTEIATIATLEIAPINGSDGWLLRIVVEDEAGPRVSDGDEGDEGDQRLDVGNFYNKFIRAERGLAQRSKVR